MRRNTDVTHTRSFISPGKPLYLARDVLGTGLRYSLRQTYHEADSDELQYREVFNLGQSPQDFIIYLDDNGYSIDPRLTEHVEPFITGDAEEMVEELLWPFVRRFPTFFKTASLRYANTSVPSREAFCLLAATCCTSSIWLLSRLLIRSSMNLRVPSMRL